MNAFEEPIKNVLDKMKLKYEYNDEHELFVFFMRMDNSIGSLRIVIQLLKERYLVYAVLNNRTPKSRFTAVSEFLHRANYGLINGNFELNYTNGEIRYKSYVNAKETSISELVIRESLTVPIMMFSKYGDGLLSVMTGKSNPEFVIKGIESAE